MKRSAIAATFLLIALSAAALGPNDKQAFLTVNPLAGETKTTKSGGSKCCIRQASTTSQNTSKSITRNMKWNCVVRYRGKPKPEKVELRVFYIGYEANDMKPKILGKDVKKLELDENGKASVDIESPTVRYSKSRTTTPSRSGCCGRSNTRILPKTKSVTRGQRMAGCVVQLWEDGELVKSYASMSQWSSAAKERDFSDATLNRKEKNRLN